MSNDCYQETYDALAHEIWAVAQLAPGEGIVDGVARIEALLRKMVHPAITHCEDCGCDWLDNGVNPVGCPYCKQSGDIKILVAERNALEAENEALRAEVERLREEVDALREALRELITWIPSADTYRRLGFDHGAPMRALGKACAALAKGGKEAGND